MKTITFILTLLILSIGCENEIPSFGEYYEYAYNDTLAASVPLDSFYLLLVQTPSYKSLFDVPYTIEIDSTLTDSLIIRLEVLCGSYSQNPKPQTKISFIQDTLFVWYSHIMPYNNIFSNNSSDKNIERTISTSPLPEYYNVQFVHIYKSPEKVFTFHSRYYQ